MGVRGLTSLAATLHEAWLVNKLPTLKAGSPPVVKIVVDGSALLFHLYFSSSLNCIGGGQYAEFAVVARDYVRTLLSCGLSLFVIFDGIMDDSKLETCLGRERECIRRCKSMVASEKEQVSEKMLPPFCLQVFQGILQELGVRFCFADREADRVVAKIAQQNGCCVMSQDSDFFIYDIPASYLPIDNVRLVNGGIQTRRINCEKLAAKLQFSKNLLPLFASLVGNDFVAIETLRNFHGHILEMFPKKEGSSSRHAVINGICQWLGKFTELEAALSAAVELCCKERQSEEKTGEEAAAAATTTTAAAAALKPEDVRKTLESSIKMYVLDGVEAFVGGESGLKTHSGKAIPPALIGGFRNGVISWMLMDVLVNRKFWCGSVLVEDVQSEAAWLAARTLRQVCFGIVLGSEPKTAKDIVTEFIRKDTDFVSEEVAPLYALEDSTKIPSINDIPKLDHAARVSFFLKALKSDTIVPQLKQLPAEWIIPVLALRFWIVNSPQKVKGHEVTAFLIAMCQPRDKIKKSLETRPHYLNAASIQTLATYQVMLQHVQFLNSLLQNVFAPLNHQKAYDGLLLHKLLHELDPKRNLGGSRILRAHGGTQEAFDTYAAAVLGGDWQQYIDGQVTLNKIQREKPAAAAGGVSGGIKDAAGGIAPVSTNIFALALDDENDDDDDDVEDELNQSNHQQELTPSANQAFAPLSATSIDSEGSESLPIISPGRAAARQHKKKQFTVPVDPEIAALAAQINAIDSSTPKVSKSAKKKAKAKAKKEQQQGEEQAAPAAAQ